MQPYLLVALGGALGAMARFAIGEFFHERVPTTWPYATFLINVSGCLVIAAFLGFSSARAGLNPAWRYLFPIGFVGAYTTFSTYAYETQRLIERGAIGAAAVYLVASNLLGLAAVYLGLWLGRRI